MHPSYRQYGLAETDRPYIAAFEGWARKQGWTQPQIDSAYAWYAMQPLDATHEALVESFSSHAEEQNWPREACDAALIWHGAVQEHGIDALTPAPARIADDASTVSEVTRTMRDEPQRYWSDPDMQRAYYDALERAAGKAETRPAPSADTSRRHAIETLMRNDGHTYWRDEAMQQEYAAILARQLDDAGPENSEVTA